MSRNSIGEEILLKTNQIIHLLSLDSESLLKECKITRYQASGPGGQKRNRIRSAVRLHHPLSGLEATACDTRQASQNLASAIFQLRMKAALMPAGPEFALIFSGAGDFLTFPGDWPPFRIQINPKHRDFPCMVFRALHQILQRKGVISMAAIDLGISTSALIKFCRKNKSVWMALQNLRTHFQRAPVR